MSLDYYKILNGTLEKRFVNGRRDLVEDYDQSSASDFFYIYKDAPLSFILAHSRDIFSETYYGYPFYLNIIKNVIVPPTRYGSEQEKVRNHIDGLRERHAPQEQIEKYESLLELLDDLTDCYSHISDVIKLVEQSDNGIEFLTMVYDGLYDVFLCEQKYQDDDRCLGYTSIHRNYIAEAIFTAKSPYAAVALGLLITNKYPKEYASCLMDLTVQMCNPINEPSRYGSARRTINAIRHMMKSGFVVKMLNSIPNKAIFDKWTSIANSPLDKILPIPKPASNTNGFIPEADGSNLGELDSFIEEMENDTKYITSRYDTYRYNAEKLGADNELYSKDDELKENDEDLQDEYEAQTLILEWEDDGSPNAVIQNHIMTSKERAEAEEARRKDKKSPINNLVADNDAVTQKNTAEDDLCKKIKASIEIASKLTPADTKSEKEDNEETLSSLRSDCRRYKAIIDENNYESAKKLYDELREEISAADNNVTEECGSDTDTMLRSFLNNGSIDVQSAIYVESDDTSDGGEKSSPATAQKPHHDLATRVQNKALDYAAKDSEKAAKSAEERQKFKNAANAISQKPKRTISGLQEFVSNFDKWDENRRKKFMLKPGFRHKIFKHMRNALMLGVAANVKLAYIPMMGLIAHVSRMKDDRIRTELTRELENEIKICEEKINDANSDGDKKSKYELMRIKDKLEAEKVRVKINSKYI